MDEVVHTTDTRTDSCPGHHYLSFTILNNTYLIIYSYILFATCCPLTPPNLLNLIKIHVKLVTMIFSSWDQVTKVPTWQNRIKHN